MNTQTANHLRNHPVPLSDTKDKVKRIEVDALRMHINGMLSMDSISQAEKATLCVLLENMLHATHNYHGYGYLGWMDGGYRLWKEAGEPEDRKDFFRGNEYDRLYY